MLANDWKQRERLRMDWKEAKRWNIVQCARKALGNEFKLDPKKEMNMITLEEWQKLAN